MGVEAVVGLKIEKGLAAALVEVAAKNIKKAKSELDGMLTFTSFAPNGVEIVQKAFASFEKPKDAEVQLLYLGAPKYQIRVVADDFKAADKAMDSIVESIMAFAKETRSVAEFAKMEQ